MEWVDAAKKGGRTFYWVVSFRSPSRLFIANGQFFSSAVSDREELIKKHIEKYPRESTPLKDTASEVRLVPRQPTMVEFLPIGHVAVDIHPSEEDVKLGLPPTGTVWIHALYISRALHGGGYGAGTMAKIEELATQEPMNAKIVALDTISREMQTDPDKREFLYGEGRLPPPIVVNEDWYLGLGYEVIKREDNGYLSEPHNGVRLPMRIVYMKKPIV
ncbi:hypothetical protein M426DRAFT_8002 [Hypoxylon sp. CI-4A]|nr:hypothetical protein M426DRAFT_8002 [Hypoxylon sp. CI-4A]